MDSKTAGYPVFADEKKTLKYTTEMIIKCGQRLDNAKNQKKNSDL